MLVGGWFKFSQPHLLTMAAATLQSILDQPGSRARRAGAAPLGVSGAGGRGGRRPGRVQYWRGKEQHCTASRPSRPPGARDPAPRRLKRDQPKDPERSGKLGSPGRPERPGARKREEGMVKEERGEAEGPTSVSRRPLLTPGRCARSLLKYAGCAARSRGPGNAYPSNRTKGCCPATPGVEVLRPPT